MHAKLHVFLAMACLSGTLLSGCASRPTSAPVSERPAVSVPAAKPPVAQAAAVPGATVPATTTPAAAPADFYQVKRGDTLYSIALDHGVDHREVAQWNRLENPSRIQAGQQLRVTPPEGTPQVRIGAARGAGSVESRPLAARSMEAQPAGPAMAGGTKTEPKALRLPYSNENVAMLRKSDAAQGSSTPPPARAETRQDPAVPAASKPEAKPAAETRDPDAMEFIWPARGKLLAGFSEPANKGVDIGGKPGDPVVASAPGRVIYVGTGIRGYGKLIVIKHDNNFNSVYAHNREILVKQDQTVARGQKIAELGDTDSDTPKLHFEIRKSGKPVDPVKYLSGAPPS